MVDSFSESGIPYINDEGNQAAGAYPFRSGIHPEMYRQKSWTMRQYAGFGDPLDANFRLRKLIEDGVTGLSIAFDLPTQMGLDPDHELSLGEVGNVGVSISSLDDMRLLFQDIDISEISTSMTINATAPILLIMYEIVANERGVNSCDLKGTIQNDILKEFISRGTYIFPVEPSMRLLNETIEYCNFNLPNWNPISISGYHMAEAGATPVQEIAFTFANAIAYIDNLEDSKKTIDDTVERVSFFFSSSTSLLEEICKFRAAREVWAKLLKEKYGVSNSKSLKMRFHTQTAGVQLQAQDPELNIVRVTLQALGAIFGGTQSLHTNSYDEALSIPSEDAARIAIRTQQIIFEESDLRLAVDPFRGSYLIEGMTDKFVDAISEEMSKIEELGGAVEALKIGYQMSRIEENAYKTACRIDSGEKRIVGVNCWQSQGKIRVLNRVNHSSSDNITNQNLSYKMNRIKSFDNEIEELSIVASSDKKLIPSIKRCILAGMTVGEICEVLKQSWGTY
jgi:methylmalonyl-CoA mutase N-terminal domain/subunit